MASRSNLPAGTPRETLTYGGASSGALNALYGSAAPESFCGYPARPAAPFQWGDIEGRGRVYDET